MPAVALVLHGDIHVEMDDDQQPDEFAVPRPPLREGLRKRPRASASLPDWNATSHADRHGHDCPSAPAMHSGRTDVTVTLHR
jgi:hypothetical protein